MGILIGPTPWWQQNVIAVSPVGTTLPDGSTIICKAGGTAWIVSPFCTQVGQTWNNNISTVVGNKCCVCDWPTLCTRMISCGFTPADWFVPTQSQLQNPGYVCRTRWTFSPPPWGCYWSSIESDATGAREVRFCNGNSHGLEKCRTNCVRAFRCVTY